MTKLKIEGKLIEFENKLDYQKTPRLRAEEILTFLKSDLEKINAEDLIGSTKQASAFTTTINHIKQIPELKFAFKILEHFIEFGSFNLVAIGDDVTLFNDINERLKILVNKFESNGQLLLSE